MAPPVRAIQNTASRNNRLFAVRLVAIEGHRHLPREMRRNPLELLVAQDLFDPWPQSPF